MTEQFRVCAEWIVDGQDAAEALGHELMERGAETAGSGPIADNRCGCCGNPLADEETS